MDIPLWKKNKVKNQATHSWLQRRHGNPHLCDFCKTTGDNKIFHWANISGQYKRERSDWVRLCISCHGLFDRKAHSEANKNRKNKTSRFMGVCWDKRRKKWEAPIRFRQKRFSLGFFINEEDAADTYNVARQLIEQHLKIEHDEKLRRVQSL